MADDLGVVVVSAGASRRMGGVDKVFAPVLGHPLVAYPLAVFEACPQVAEVVLVVASHRLEDAQTLVERYGFRKVRAICPGGPRRQDSVREGLARLSPSVGWVAVHDGARPLVDPYLVEEGLRTARRTGASAPAVPLKDTVKRVAPDGRVLETLPREALRAVQTPQVFRRDLLERAHREVQEEVTDDAGMVERIGGTVLLFPGSPANLKVTTREDLALVEALLGLHPSPLLRVPHGTGADRPRL